MIILPSLIFGFLAALMTLTGKRTVALTSWVLALVFMLGAMRYHMNDVLNISL